MIYMINMNNWKQRNPNIIIKGFANKTDHIDFFDQHRILQECNNDGKTNSSRKGRKLNPLPFQKRKILFQEQVLTESPPLEGGRNFAGGTRIVSKKNIE